MSASDYDGQSAEMIDVREVTRAAYAQQIGKVGDLLRSGLSVLVTCDKAVTRYVWDAMVEASGRPTRADLQLDAEGILPASDSAADYPYPYLARLRESLAEKPGGSMSDVVVLPYLDMLADRTGMVPKGAVGALVEVLHNAPDAVLLGFVDPSLPVPAIVAQRFAAHITLRGLPREVRTQDGTARPFSSMLLTPQELAHFHGLEPGKLHWHISGLSPLILRQAVRYAMLEHAGRDDATAEDFYRAIRTFKANSSVTGLASIPPVSFDEIGGYEPVKDELRTITKYLSGAIDGRRLTDWLRRELFPRAVLLYGPPGTGKTSLAVATADALTAISLVVSGPEIVRLDPLETERRISAVFAEARRIAPAVLIFDEFDAIAARRPPEPVGDDEGHPPGWSPVNRVAAEIDELSSETSVLVIGLTNRLELIDAALLRPSRFRPIRVGLPDIEARRAIVRLMAQRYEVPVAADLVDELAAITEDWSGGDIREAFRTATANALREDGAVDAQHLGEVVGRMQLAFNDRRAYGRLSDR